MKMLKKYDISFRLRGDRKSELMHYIGEGFNADDARYRARDVVGEDFYVVKAELIRG